MCTHCLTLQILLNERAKTKARRTISGNVKEYYEVTIMGGISALLFEELDTPGLDKAFIWR